MRTAPSAKFTELVESRELIPIPLVTLTAPGGTVFRWSDGPTLFDSEDIQPFLIETSTFRQVMDHLPSDTSFGELTRNFDFSLRNGEVDDVGTRLAKTLRDASPLGGTIEFRQLILDRRDVSIIGMRSEREDVRVASAANLSTVFFRGTLEQLGPINNELIRMSCTGEQIVGGLETGRLTQENTTIGQYDAIGAKHSVVYGDARKVRALPVSAGFLTTLATPMGFDDTEATLSDTTVVPPFAGVVRIGGERMTYTAVAGNQITGLVRDDFVRAEHFTGDTVAFVPVSIVYSLAAEASKVVDIWIRNPLNDELLRVTTPYQVVLEDSASVVDQTFSSVQFTTQNWDQLLDAWIANARITAQAAYEDAGGTPVATDTVVANGTHPTFQDQSRAEDGNWDDDENTWDYTPIASQGPKDLVRHSYASVANGARNMIRLRGHITMETVTASAEITKATFLINYINPKLGIDISATFDVLSVREYENFTGWVDLDPNTNTVADLLDGRFEYGWSDVDDTFNNAVYQGEILAIEVEYEYVDPADLIDISSPAAIQAQSGGAGVEMYADINGPVVPAPPSVFVPGYAFDDGTEWDDDGDVVHSDGGIFQTLTIAPSVGGTLFNLEFDAANWVYEFSAPGTVADAFVDGRDCLEVTMGDVNVIQSQVVRDISPAQDWSTFASIEIDIYIPAGPGFDARRGRSNDDFIVFRDTSAIGLNQVSFHLNLLGKVPVADTWTTLSYNIADPQSDEEFNNEFGSWITNVDTIRMRVTSSIITVHNWSDIRQSSGSSTTAGFIQKNPADLEAVLDADGDLFRLACRATGFQGTGHVARIELSNPLTAYPGVPTEAKHITLDPGALSNGQITQLNLTSIDVGGTPPLSTNNVRTIRVHLEINNTSGGVFDVFNLNINEEGLNPYSVAGLTLLEHPVDVVRHFITERAGIDASKIDESSFADALTNLGSNEIAANVSQLGDDDVSMLKQLGYEHRFQLVQRDTDAGTQYQMLTQKANRTWEAPIATVTEWQDLVETSGDLGDVITRRAFSYRRDPSEGFDLEAFEQALQVEATANDLDPALPTSLLTDAEDAFGLRLGGVTFFYTIRDEDTARDVAEFWTREELSVSSIFAVIGVPWTQAYFLERGDTISLTPPWSPQVNLRVLTVDKPADEFVTLICKQVATS